MAKRALSPRPPLWRVWAGLIGAPALPLLVGVAVMFSVMGLPPAALGMNAAVLVVIGVLSALIYLAPPVMIGALLYFQGRKRVRITPLVCMAGGAVALPFAPVLIRLMTFARGGEGFGPLAGLIGLFAVIGAICGLIFWLVAQAGAKPGPGAEDAF